MKIVCIHTDAGEEQRRISNEGSAEPGPEHAPPAVAALEWFPVVRVRVRVGLRLRMRDRKVS